LFKYPIRLLLFWLSLFLVFRLWFVLWFKSAWSNENPQKIWSAFSHALPLDVSLSGYLMTFPLFLWIIALFFNKENWQKNLKKTTNLLNIGLVFLISLISIANLSLYKEWNTLINQRAIDYLKSPSGLFHSMSISYFIGFGLILFLVVFLIYKFYQFFVNPYFLTKIENRKSLWFLLFVPISLLIFIRGSIGVMPVNESAVYYSSHLFDNHAATNPTWHLMHTLVEKRAKSNPYIWFEQRKAELILEEFTNYGVARPIPLANYHPLKIQPTNFSTPEPLNAFSDAPFNQSTNQPNIVILLMESMTANVIEALGGEADLTPNLDTLLKGGLLFTNCYGSGYRTDQGIISVLSGFPAQPDQSIILQEDKVAKLSSIPAELKDKGYENAFFYGSELTFANMGVYLRQQQFELIFDEKVFNLSEKTQRWGVDDNIVLQKAAKEMGKLKTPFFSTVLTLSLHPPFDVPYQSKWSKSEIDADKFRNSTLFADDAIGNFFRTARKEPWFDNTVFILVADHGAVYPQQHRMDSPHSRHIPLIIYGQPISDEYKGSTSTVFCNHHDIPATLFSMLNIKPKNNFSWSRNLLEFPIILKNKPSIDSFDKEISSFAYFTNENGLGWITQKGNGFYSFENKNWASFGKKLDSNQQEQAKAYLQLLYKQFIGF
jgi:phosphoglycerol transferase MdoB-like AlkP superfamily enzyme